MKLKDKMRPNGLNVPSTESSIDHYVMLFLSYLQPGLSEDYIKNLFTIARIFLHETFGTRPIKFSRLKPYDILNFVNHYSRDHSLHRIKKMTTCLRVFLRFLKCRGFVTTDFSGIVPHVALWAMDRGPDYLDKDEIALTKKGCDKKTPIGLRDYTILCVLSDLGLRAYEIANLTLEDFDWTNGELLVKGKGSKMSRMPLTQDLGDNLVAYLINGRPRCPSRFFFISAYPPFHGVLPRTISQIVARAFKRAGIIKKGKAHLFRHSLATQLLNKGATLQQVGDVLRHQSVNTTAIYAKVDFKRLSSLAQPWLVNFGGTV